MLAFAASFPLLQSGVDKVEGINDEKEYSIVRRCFTTLGFDEEAVVNPILRSVAGVLQLGNLNFEVT